MAKARALGARDPGFKSRRSDHLVFLFPLQGLKNTIYLYILPQALDKFDEYATIQMERIKKEF